MGKLKMLLLLPVLLLAACSANAAQMAGPVPPWSVAPAYTCSHRRIPQSTHGLSGVVADIRWEVGNGSEQFHIGDWNSDSRQDLPAYKLRLDADCLDICIYAYNVPHQKWSGKLDSIADQSSLITGISWELPEDAIYVLLRLDLAGPIKYRSWYYTNTGYFTIELAATDET